MAKDPAGLGEGTRRSLWQAKVCLTAGLHITLSPKPWCGVTQPVGDRALPAVLRLCVPGPGPPGPQQKAGVHGLWREAGPAGSPALQCHCPRETPPLGLGLEEATSFTGALPWRHRARDSPRGPGWLLCKGGLSAPTPESEPAVVTGLRVPCPGPSHSGYSEKATSLQSLPCLLPAAALATPLLSSLIPRVTVLVTPQDEDTGEKSWGSGVSAE